MATTKEIIEIMKKNKSTDKTKVEIFMCNQINSDNLKTIEREINNFTATHDVIDIKVNTVGNQYGAIVIYTVCYKEDDDGE